MTGTRVQAANEVTEPLKLTLAPAAVAAAPGIVSTVRADARTGRLVRSVVLKSAAGKGVDMKARTADAGVRALVAETAKNLDVPAELVDSVIQVESNYNSYAISPKGAQGLMQLMPATARRFGVTNSFDPKQNIEGGVRYLKFLKETFKDDRLAIAAYNAGEGAVARYKDVPPYPETVSYVAKVGKKYGQARQAAEQSVAKSKAEEKPKPAEDQTHHIVGYFDQEGRLHFAAREAR